MKASSVVLQIMNQMLSTFEWLVEEIQGCRKTGTVKEMNSSGLDWEEVRALSLADWRDAHAVLAYRKRGELA